MLKAYPQKRLSTSLRKHLKLFLLEYRNVLQMLNDWSTHSLFYCLLKGSVFSVNTAMKFYNRLRS